MVLYIYLLTHHFFTHTYDIIPAALSYSGSSSLRSLLSVDGGRILARLGSESPPDMIHDLEE